MLPKCGFTGGPECFLRSVLDDVATTPSRNVNEAVEELSLSKHMQVDRTKQRVAIEHVMRASSSVSTQVYSRRNSFRNRRNRVHETNRSSSGDRVSVCANWPPDALFMLDTSSPFSNEATSFDPALFEANICGQASSNISVSSARML